MILHHIGESVNIKFCRSSQDLLGTEPIRQKRTQKRLPRRRKSLIFFNDLNFQIIKGNLFDKAVLSETGF